jgi:hypothetical protein
VASNGESETSKFTAWPELFSLWMPKINGFEFPKIEVPQVFRDFANNKIVEVGEVHQNVKKTADQVNEALLASCMAFANSAAAFNTKVIEAAFSNSNATFGYAQKLLDAKTLSEFAELSTTHARQQFDAWSEQAETLSALAEKAVADTVKPINVGVAEAFEKAA